MGIFSKKSFSDMRNNLEIANTVNVVKSLVRIEYWVNNPVLLVSRFLRKGVLPQDVYNLISNGIANLSASMIDVVEIKSKKMPCRLTGKNGSVIFDESVVINYLQTGVLSIKFIDNMTDEVLTVGKDDMSVFTYNSITDEIGRVFLVFDSNKVKEYL